MFITTSLIVIGVLFSIIKGISVIIIYKEDVSIMF